MQKLKYFFRRELKLAAFIVCVAALSSTCNGIFFQCAFSTVDYGQPIGELYGCTAVANLTDNNLNKLTTVLGNHTLGKTNAHVNVLQVQGNPFGKSVDKLPNGISRFFPNLVIFNWINGRLKVLSQRDFKPFPNLIRADFQMNMIKKLDGDLFKFNKKLQWLNFGYNEIRVVEKNFFDGLTELTELMFWSNTCVATSNVSSMDIEQDKAIILWLCAPEKETECPQQCTDRFITVESRVSAVETKTSELQAFLKIIYELRQ